MEQNPWANSDMVTHGIDRIPPYDPERREHYWIVTLAYRVTPERFLNPDFAPPILDHECLAAFLGPGCFYCETPYSPELAARPCLGEYEDLTEDV